MSAGWSVDCGVALLLTREMTAEDVIDLLCFTSQAAHAIILRMLLLIKLRHFFLFVSEIWALFEGYERWRRTCSLAVLDEMQVGTPGRMHALAAAGSLRLDSSALIVLDMEKNIKGRNVLDMDGVANDTMALLADYVRPSLTSSSSTSSLPEPDAASSAKGSKKNKKRKKNGGGGKGKGAEGQLRIALY